MKNVPSIQLQKNIASLVTGTQHGEGSAKHFAGRRISYLGDRGTRNTTKSLGGDAKWLPLSKD